MSEQSISLVVNGEPHQFELDPATPLLYALREDLGLKAAKYGCGTELCGACKVLVDGVDVPSCQLPIERVAGLEITTLEGLAGWGRPASPARDLSRRASRSVRFLHGRDDCGGSGLAPSPALSLG